MALDLSTFHTIIPSRFLSFTIPHPTLASHLLRIAVLDSPIQPSDSPRVAALFVPHNRESDWVFTTESGHLQLLLSSPGISRLILVGNNPINDNPCSVFNSYNKNGDAQFVNCLVTRLKPLFTALSPLICVKDRTFDVPILAYEDNLISSIVLEICSGVFVGDMLIEDVETENDNGKREFRKRLRFKRMPNLIQTEVRIVPKMDCGLDCVTFGGGVDFRLDLGTLVHPYLIPMVAGLSLVSCHIEDRIRKGLKPKALCLGVGGGSLLSFLRTQLNFEVFGVEMDAEVLGVARKYFGLEDEGIQVFLGDAMEFLEKLSCQGTSLNLVSDNIEEDNLICTIGVESKFDVIMVDLDTCDPMTGVSAPPLELIQKHILLAARSVICDSGVLIMNVIPPTRSFYDSLLSKLWEVFPELYEIDVGNGENFVIVAKMLPVLSLVGNSQSTFLKKLREVLSGKYLDCISKV